MGKKIPPKIKSVIKEIVGDDLPITGVNAAAKLETIDGSGPVFKSASPEINEKAEEYIEKRLAVETAKYEMRKVGDKLLQLMEFEKVPFVCLAVSPSENVKIEIRFGEDRLKITKA